MIATGEHRLVETPLKGKRIVVTRPSSQANVFIDRLHHAGAEVIVFPTIQIHEPDSWDSADEAIQNVNEYDGCFFTSSNAVDAFYNRLNKIKPFLIPFYLHKMNYAVGSRTETALRKRGCDSISVPQDYRSQEVLSLLKEKELIGKRFLHPRGNLGNGMIKSNLETRGALGGGASRSCLHDT